MLTALCILLFAAGHIVRDGWPSFKDMTHGRLGTHAARISGALLCGLGAYAVSDSVPAALVGAGVLAGFYFDMKHGEGQGADSWASAGYLLLSGITSLVPLALLLIHPTVSTAWTVVGMQAVVIVIFQPQHLALLAVGLLKPPLWILAWRGLRAQTGWFVPTRIAAGLFGAAIGGAVASLT